MDPAKVAKDAQSLPYANRVALPATLSNTRHQQEILKEIKDDEAPDDLSSFAGSVRGLFGRSFINSKYGYVEWSSKVLEERYTSRDAMKAPPAKSALDGNVTAAKTTEIANEILNEMQRNRGGAVETEDVSRYQVTVHRPDAKDVPDWVGEVIGPPSIIEQKTVTIVRGGRMVVVLDKSNKKLWQADLAHKFVGGTGFEDSDPGEPSLGEGPCVEHGDALYVFDEATLTAFDLATGNVRWRVPSIGITGLFFDDQGFMYVNSTSADLESIKYSRQIDISKKTSASVLRIECKTGKVLWNVDPGGFISHVEGKFVLCFASYDAPEVDPDSLAAINQMHSVMALRRLNPKNGKVMFDYGQPRAPLFVRFRGNVIELVFRKEVQVLKFLSF
jgi:outer membrane protein assembly factor BamB